MLTSLTLKHWRTHAQTTLEFGKGTNVIVGVMGSGKSSIVNAISYSLFGTFPALKTRQITLEEIIMNKPNEQATAETSLEFEQNENKYKVQRIIKKDGTNEAKLYENERLVAGPKQKDVNERIEKLLGLNYELFSRAVYAEQNEIDFFLRLSPSERKKKFDELLELEKYESARKNAITLQNEMVKENKQRKEFIAQQKQTIQSHEEDKILTKIAEEDTAIHALEKEIALNTKEMLQVEKEYSTLAQKEKDAKTIEELIVKAETKLETLKEDIKKAGKINLTELIDEIEKTKNELMGLKEKALTAEKELKEKEHDNRKNGEEIKVLEYERKKLVEEEKSILTLKGKCPTCKQELNEEHKKKLEEEIKEKNLAIDGKLGELNLQKSTLTEKIQLIEKEKEMLKKETEEKSRALYKMESEKKQATELEEKKKQYKELDDEMPKIRKQLLSLGFNKKKLENTREEVYKKKSAMSIAETKIKAKQELKKSYLNNLEKIALIRKNIEEGEKQIMRTEEAAQKLGIFGNCLIATQIELRESLIETINQAMTTIWQATYPYKDFIDARLGVVADGYDLEVSTRNNNWVRVEGILSGGERSAAALCIRIAFALVLTKKLSMLILDEPTHNLDTNAIAKLAGMLRDELPKLVEQIFVITHDKELKNAANSNLYVLSRNKDADEATRAEQLEAR